MLLKRVQRVARTHKNERFESDVFNGRCLAFRIFPVPEGVGVLFLNTTELQDLRRLLEETSALDIAIRGNSRVALVQIDQRGRIIIVSGAFSDWSGFKSSDIIGLRVVDLVAGPDRRRAAEAFEEVQRSRTPASIRVTIITRDGAELDCTLAASPIFADFMPRGVCIVLARNAAEPSERD